MKEDHKVLDVSLPEFCVTCKVEEILKITFHTMLIEYSLPREMQIKQNIGITGEFTEDVPIEIVRTYYITEDTKLH